MFWLSIINFFLFLYIYQTQKSLKDPQERSIEMGNGIEATKRVGQGTTEPIQTASKSSNIGNGSQDINSHNVTNINIFNGDKSGNVQNAKGGDNSIFDQAQQPSGAEASEQAGGCEQPSGAEASEQAGGCEQPSGAEASEQAGGCEAPSGAEASQKASPCQKSGEGKGKESAEEKIMNAFQEAIQEVTEQTKQGKTQGASESGKEAGCGGGSEGKGNVEQMQGGEGKGNKKELKEEFGKFNENLKKMGVDLPKGTVKELVQLTAEKAQEPPEKVLKTLNGVLEEVNSKKSQSQESQAA